MQDYTVQLSKATGPYWDWNEGDLNIDERIVADLIAACQAVAAKLEAP